MFACLSYLSQSQVTQYNFSHLDVNDGLSHNQVRCAVEDTLGFLWFGTMSGLNRFDGYSFKVYKNDPSDTTSLHDNYVDQLQIDALGRLWVKSNSVFSVFDYKTETFKRNEIFTNGILNLSLQEIYDFFNDYHGYTWFTTIDQGIFITNFSKNNLEQLKHNENNTNSISSDYVTSIAHGVSGEVWIIHNNGVLEQLEYTSRKVIWRDTLIASKNHYAESDYRLFLDQDNDLWIYSKNNAYGIYYYNTNSKKPIHFNTSNKKHKLKSDITLAVTEDNSGVIWVGTDHGGINLINKKDLSVEYLLKIPDHEKSLSQNSITTLYKDEQGIIWIGTFKKGINYFHEDLFRFRLIRNYPSNPASLPFNDVNCFTEDDVGNLWIGTNGGGLIYYDRKNEIFTTYRNDPSDPNSLSNDVIVSLLYDSKKRLWIGTYYGGLNYFNEKTFKCYLHNTDNSYSISDNRVWEIFEDSKGKIWLGLLGGGLDLFVPEENKFYNYKGTFSNPINSKYIISIAEDETGDLWLGTDDGVYEFNENKGVIRHFTNKSNELHSLSNNSIFKVFFDSRGLLWIGTREGLNLFDEETETFKRFTQKEGLSDNSVLTILEDNRGHLWMGTSNGLCNMQITTKSNKSKLLYTFKNYNESDGLQGSEFYEKSAFKSKSGELFFGGSNGFNIFSPERLASEIIFPKVVLVDFLVFNKSVLVNEELDGRILLKESITSTEEIKLKYQENIITFEFAALDYLDQHNIVFRYKLEGFNDDWMITDGTNRLVTFTNLNPGKYRFRVQATKDFQQWSDEEASLYLIIKPPFWRSYPAFLFYFLIIAGTLLLARRLVLTRERLRFQNEEAKKEARRQYELNLIKTRFFTNVSHEFRTPLTLIISPLERLLQTTKDKEITKQLKLIHTSARRLMNLVNQLLDFRRMEVQQLTLNPSYHDIIGFVYHTFLSFTDIAETKKIKFEFNSTIDELFMQYDADKMEKTLFNVLSNAFKYTHEEDEIRIDIDIAKNTENESSAVSEELKIKVIDTGIGIASENHERIFERFFQDKSPSKIVSQGSGIGLALSKEFVKLHGGEITVESAINKGSCFIITLPVNRNKIEEPVPEDERLVTEEITGDEHKESSKELILIVEDNEDFRFYLRDNLSIKYKIAEASNGIEGFNKTLELLPDLIVSDLKMPEMNGIELCVKVKQDKRSSHIPFILLTASITEEHKIKSYQSGADEYIIKPFSFEILESRILNLIEQRKRIRKSFQKHFEIKPGEVTITSIDEKLINKALKYVEENISDSDLSVERLSQVMGISRVHLYKKMLSITGKKPVEFIRLVRLRRAEQLLLKSQLNVSEIAYEVGFNDPRYFSKMFKEEYNVLPSRYKQNRREN